MPRALCITGIAIAAVMLLFFGLDLMLPNDPNSALSKFSPFQGVSTVMDVTMLASALILGLLSWLTLREL